MPQEGKAKAEQVLEKMTFGSGALASKRSSVLGSNGVQTSVAASLYLYSYLIISISMSIPILTFSIFTYIYICTCSLYLYLYLQPRVFIQAYKCTYTQKVVWLCIAWRSNCI